MICKDVKELLSEFTDNRLAEEEMQQIKEHIYSCPDCQIELQELRKLEALLSDIDDVPVPEVFDARLHAALAEEAKKIRNQHIIPMYSSDTPIIKKKFKHWKRISSIAAVFMVGLFSAILYNDNLDEFNKQALTNENVKSQITGTAIENGQGKAQDTGEISETDKIDEIVPQQETGEELSGGSSQAKVDIEPQTQDVPQVQDQVTDQMPKQRAMLQNAPTPQNDRTKGVSPQAFNAAYVPEELEGYFKQLEQILIDTDYEIDSYTVDYTNSLWTITVVITTKAEDGSQIKESAIYCGQDGKLWKKQL